MAQNQGNTQNTPSHETKVKGDNTQQGNNPNQKMPNQGSVKSGDQTHSGSGNK
jgi:hypothetical protein